jgi:hypothetical protein
MRHNRNPGATYPFVVERLEDVVEHIRGGPRVLHTSTSYSIHKVGYYATQAEAFKAADRSARRHGGYVRNINGSLYPSFPYEKGSA